MLRPVIRPLPQRHLLAIATPGTLFRGISLVNDRDLFAVALPLILYHIEGYIHVGNTRPTREIGGQGLAEIRAQGGDAVMVFQGRVLWGMVLAVAGLFCRQKAANACQEAESSAPQSGVSAAVLSSASLVPLAVRGHPNIRLQESSTGAYKNH